MFFICKRYKNLIKLSQRLPRFQFRKRIEILRIPLYKTRMLEITLFTLFFFVATGLYIFRYAIFLRYKTRRSRSGSTRTTRLTRFFPINYVFSHDDTVFKQVNFGNYQNVFTNFRQKKKYIYNKISVLENGLSEKTQPYEISTHSLGFQMEKF